ncbi:putative isoprenylcysteine alpha-carbonyl methylesterase icmel1 [Asimina triloba]
MEGEQSLDQFSPERIAQNPSYRHAMSLLPRIILLHGTADYSIPSDASGIFPSGAFQSIPTWVHSINNLED